MAKRSRKKKNGIFRKLYRGARSIYRGGRSIYRGGRKIYKAVTGNNSGSVRPSAIRSTVQKGLLPFGMRYFCKLPFVACGTITTAADALIVIHSFTLNSMFDPNLTGGARQPFQYDQLTPMYNKYTVYGCKYEITFSNPTQNGLHVGVLIRANTNATATASGATIEDVMEQKLVSLRHISSQGSRRQSFRGYVKPSQVFAVAPVVYKVEERYSAVVNATPTNTVILEACAVSVGSTATVITFVCKLTMYAMLWDYITPGSS